MAMYHYVPGVPQCTMGRYIMGHTKSLDENHKLLGYKSHLGYSTLWTLEVTWKYMMEVTTAAATNFYGFWQHN